MAGRLTLTPAEAPRRPLRQRTSGAGSRNPALTRAAILEAAVEEFSAKGLDGARVDSIAERAGANKRMLYHYFGNKEALYLAVLEETYRGIRLAEAELHLDHLPPEEGMRRMVEFTWGYFRAHPEFLSILNTENLMQARNLRRSPAIRELHSPLLRGLEDLLARGAAEGVFRRGVDPMQLYITIAALGFFYLSNRATLSTIFGRDLTAPEALEERGAHVVEVVLGYLRPPEDTTGTKETT